MERNLYAVLSREKSNVMDSSKRAIVRRAKHYERWFFERASLLNQLRYATAGLGLGLEVVFLYFAFRGQKSDNQTCTWLRPYDCNNMTTWKDMEVGQPSKRKAWPAKFVLIYCPGSISENYRCYNIMPWIDTLRPSSNLPSFQAIFTVYTFDSRRF